MADNLIRQYKVLDVKELKKSLLIHGDLSSVCANCKEMDLKLSDKKCSKCGVEFKSIAFRNIRSHIPKIHKLFIERPQVSVIDYDDYKRNEGAIKAEEFLK